MAGLGSGSGSGSDERNIFIAISSGKVNRLHSILANSECLNVRDSSHRTPLIHAVFIPTDDIRTHIVRLLLRHGCDVNAQDGAGRTALMYACMERDKIDVVRLLTKCRRCDPNLHDQDGNTALIHCVEGGNVSALRILTNHSSMRSRLQVNGVNGSGLSAVELAVKLGLADCCRILMRDGGADTTRIKNRRHLLELINEDRAKTPFDPSFSSSSPTSPSSPSPSSPGLEDMDCALTPRTVELGSLSHRSDTESYTRTSPRHYVGPDTPRPGSDFPVRMSHHNSGLSRRRDFACELQHGTRPLSRDFHKLDNPFLEMVRQDSSLYVPNSRTTFRRAIITSKDSGRKKGVDRHVCRSSSMRRPLTPIASRASEEAKAVAPLAGIPLPTRLPSIPSGKRLYSHAVLSPCETPTESA